MRNLFRRWLKFIVSAVLLVFLLTQVDLRAVLGALSDVKWVGVWVALMLFIAGVFIRAFRWQVLLQGINLAVPYRSLSSLYFVGSFFNTVLPTGFGGDAVKAAELAHASGRSGEAIGSVVTDRFLGIVALLSMGVLSLLVAGDWVNPRITWAITLLFAACLFGYWLLRKRWLVNRLVRLVPQRWREPILSFGRSLYNGLEGYSGRTLVLAMVVSLLFNMTWVAVNVALGWSLGIDVSLAQYLVFVPLVSLSLLVPSVGGLGVRELTYVGLFGLIGVPEERAFALGILIYAVTFAVGLIGGIIYLLQGAHGPRGERQPQPTAVDR
ncbi:MAG: lysylphosphatidylglycerol synthase transmembrane domain-containing protein [Caldilineales bacterium]